MIKYLQESGVDDVSHLLKKAQVIIEQDTDVEDTTEEISNDDNHHHETDSSAPEITVCVYLGNALMTKQEKDLDDFNFNLEAPS